jgi:DNA-binding NarL/FixJ family response regulator
MIRTLLAEDSPAFRTGLRQLLEADGRFAVVGEAGNGEDAVQAATRLHPNLVVLDVRMPCLDGITAAQQIHSRLPDSALVILSEIEDSALRVRAKAAGCSAYLLKRDDLCALPARLAACVAG